jgi:very-short-patch-repair endonuclease
MPHVQVVPEGLLCIEVNGEQHYNRDGSLNAYYQLRHQRIENAGWRVLELHYAHCYHDTVIDEIKKFCARSPMDKVTVF